MHLDPISGMWKDDNNDYQVPTSELPDISDTDDDHHKEVQNQPIVKGKCTLAIRFRTHGEYLKWKTLTHVTRQWEFITEYPAIMRAEYDFSNVADVELMIRKIIDLLQMGFDVYSAAWKLEEISK